MTVLNNPSSSTDTTLANELDFTPLDRDRLHSSHVSSPEDIASAHIAVSNLDETISQLQAQIGRLSVQKASLEQRRDEYACLAAPIRRLAPELLQEIFCHVPDGVNRAFVLPNASYTARWQHQRPPPIHPVFNLGMVCSHWRRCVLSQGSLWSNFHIYVDVLSPYSLALLDTLLGRANGHAISFVATVHHPDGLTRRSDAFDRAVAVCKRLFLHAPQWRNVTFSIPPSLAIVLTGAKPRFFSQLTTLHLAIFNHTDTQPLLQTDAFPSAPKLSQLTISRISLSTPPKALQMLEVTGLDVYFDDMHAFLRDCPDLKSASFTFRALLVNHRNTPINPITSHLRKLVVWMRPTEPVDPCFRQLLQQLTLPVLSELTLKWGVGTAGDDALGVTAWAETFRRSRSPIRYANLDSHQFNQSLLQLLECFDDVETLSVTSMLPADVCQLMTFRKGQMNVLPRLTSVELFIPRDHPQDLAAFVEMIDSRAQLPREQHSLISLKLTEFSQAAEIIQERTPTWQAAGVQVSVSVYM